MDRTWSHVRRPPSAGYRFGKFARRYKRAMVTGVIVAAALLIGLAGTSCQAGLRDGRSMRTG